MQALRPTWMTSGSIGSQAPTMSRSTRRWVRGGVEGSFVAHRSGDCRINGVAVIVRGGEIDGPCSDAFGLDGVDRVGVVAVAGSCPVGSVLVGFGLVEFGFGGELLGWFGSWSGGVEEPAVGCFE